MNPLPDAQMGRKQWTHNRMVTVEANNFALELLIWDVKSRSRLTCQIVKVVMSY